MIRFDMQGYLLEHGIKFKEDHKNFQLQECPSCGDNRFKFGISKEKDYISNCWICGEKFNLYGLIMRIDGISYKKAVDKVFGRKLYKPIKLSEMKRIQIQTNEKQKFDYTPESILMQMPSEFIKLEDHIAYTRERGLDLQTIKKFNLHICYSGKWKNRLIIPVYYQAMLVGWQGRAINNNVEKKIKSCSGFKKSCFLMNYDNILNSKEIMLVEGPFDFLHSWKFNSVALMGKDISNEQLNLLLKTKAKTILIALDPDFPEGIKKTALRLSQFFKVKILQIPDGKDIGMLSEIEIDNLIKKSYSLKSKLLI